MVLFKNLISCPTLKCGHFRAQVLSRVNMTKTKENKQFIVPVHNLNKVNHVVKELSYFNMYQTLLNSNNNILKTVILHLYNSLTQQMFHLFLKYK